MDTHFTKTPNIIFDELLKKLSHAELKILLVIIRQTYGWIDKRTNKRKTKDRITYTQFSQKTGFSTRTISGIIKSLSDKKIIEVRGYNGNILESGHDRKGKTKIYYSFKGTYEAGGINICKNVQEHMKQASYNKRNYYKRNNTKEKEIDFKSIKEIIEENKYRWNV